jgi:hypothetical protein
MQEFVSLGASHEHLGPGFGKRGGEVGAVLTADAPAGLEVKFLWTNVRRRTRHTGCRMHLILLWQWPAGEHSECLRAHGLTVGQNT